MNRRAFLVALACVPAAVVAKVTPSSGPFPVEYPPERAIYWDKVRSTVISFPAGAKLARVASSLDGDLRVYCMVDGSGYELRRGEDGVFR